MQRHFNEAPAFWPGKVLGELRKADRATYFNEAPAFWPGKASATAAITVTPSVTSMRPRRSGRGRA